MVYTNSRAAMKWWDSHTNKLKYCSYAKFNEHNNKFGGWLLRSEVMTGTNTSSLPSFKIDLSYHHFIKDDIFEATSNFPARGTHIVIIAQYCEHHDMSYASQSKNNIHCKHFFTERNSTNIWILRIFLNN